MGGAHPAEVDHIEFHCCIPFYLSDH